MKTVLTGLLGPANAKAFFDNVYVEEKSYVFLVEDDAKAQELCDDLRLFSQMYKLHCPLFYYPSKQSLLKSSSMIHDLHDMQLRISALHALYLKKQYILVCPLPALTQITLPVDVLGKSTSFVEVGEELDRDILVQILIDAGYEQVHQVDALGQFSVRGAILDIFLNGTDEAHRLEFFGDELESIRSFDVFTQRSIEDKKNIQISPSSEIVLSQAVCLQARKNIKAYVDERSIPASKRTNILTALEDNRPSPVYHDLLPVFYSQQQTVLDYLKLSDPVKISLDPIAIKRALHKFLDKLEEKDALLGSDDVRCYPSEHFLNIKDQVLAWENTTAFELRDITLDSMDTDNTVIEHHIETLDELKHSLKLSHKKKDPLKPLFDFIDAHYKNQNEIFLMCSNAQELDKTKGLLEQNKILTQTLVCFDQKKPNCVNLYLGELSQSFKDTSAQMVWISAQDIFGSKKRVIQEHFSPDEGVGSLKDLRKGNYVVHIDHGLGIYQGLERIKFNDIENDFLLIEYAGNDKLFLPVYRLNRIHKYIGGEGRKPTVDRLGQSSTWENTKAKAKKAVEEMAHELIELYAKRQLAQGKAYAPADQMYQAFENDFPFQETVDQLKTIEDIAKDLESAKPMDRLVCGDVGFGKTEIALRAAFRTVEEGKQAAVLVPTTILCQQHYETFKERMQGYPIKVNFLSRFQSKAEQKKIIVQLKSGDLDIVIGTHRLLSKDIEFCDLGLLVLDEEHRFGVKHKEKIKTYRNLINVLTLTATPIPRTLQLSMAGIRDLSIINTPPLDRKSVKTFLCKNDDSLIRDAIRKELARKGQTFFLHNRVDTMEAQWLHLKTLVPEAKIEFAHGQMDEKVLEQKMLSFIKKDFDVLLSTTIIESGVDVPNANTMIINRADCFGLAQLYQLRGRVGRSDREAFTYLLIPGETIISSDALKRLKALQRFSELGSGLKIAMHDLEIRGAGNLLGAAQSGHISDVGFELYTSLLEREVRKLKGEAIKEEVEPEIQTTLPAFFPEEYVKDTQERLNLYKRFSAAKDDASLESLVNEVRDRFGPVPRTVENLIEVIQMKILAKACGVSILRLSETAPSIEFTDQAPINMDKLLKEVKRNKRIQLFPDQRLSITLDPEMDCFAETKKFLEGLQ